MSSSTPTGITEISLITVPVSDQDVSVAFYESLGLEKRVDQPFGSGLRWIEVYAPSGSTGISLALPREGETVQPKETGIVFHSEDLEHTHRTLSERQVDVDAEIMRLGAPVPDMFWLRDPDGHILLVVQAAGH